ncbi:GFA family protein [Kordiimonas aquimaris]|uniref:GFA family protein n=1 Tax=Kordiimonas aquimaris TaxID=707591 RepID=UPI0021CE5FBC|nr:GFA family protein [Kordiimonas aquimaris]
MTGAEDKIELSGKCVCGAVGIHTLSASPHVGACHCNMCRQWGGGAYMSVDCGTDVSFSGEENIKVFSSSTWAERGFCQGCGTHVFYRIKETGQLMMAAGLFKEQDAFVNMDRQVFIDEKPAYYTFAEDTKNMTGAEVFAIYGPGG